MAGALRHGFAADQLYGLDADPRLPAVWQERYSRPRPHFALADGLLGAAAGCFELVVGNPPFAGGPAPEHLPFLTTQCHWWRLTHRSRPEGLPRELWFLERSLQLLSEGGRLAMVMPEGFLANRRWRPQREELLHAHTLDAVIGLPRSVFRASGIAVKTCLLFVRRQAPAPGHTVRLAELEADELAHPGALLEAWQARRTVAGPAPWRD